MRERRRIHQRTYRIAVVMITVMMVLLSGIVYAESGRINLVFANGTVSNSETVATFEFDVKAYISDGGDVLGEGMIYVKYPTNIFGDCVVYNDKVNVVKTGILSGKDQYLNGDLYKLINITDTYADVFAITFGASYYQEQMKACYEMVSSDPNNPSDLCHISIAIDQESDGTILFPSDIPGLSTLYYDYEYTVFDNGLNITEAVLDVSNNTVEEPITDPIIEPEEPVNETVFTGSVDLENFSTRVKKSTAELSWKTSNEVDINSYIIERSENGNTYQIIAETSAEPSKRKFNSYKVNDQNLNSGTTYTYKLSVVDMNGCKNELSTQNVTVTERKSIILDDGLFTLEASYPNPFNPSFIVPFSVNSTQNVDIRLYDLSGKLIQTVADNYYSPGNYKINVSCDGMASGVYLLITNVNGNNAIQKMLLTK